jgi:dihydropteroate synthase
MDKGTFFSKAQTFCSHGKLYSFDEPQVMGIINLTPDSFFRDSRKIAANDALETARQMITDGAEILDLGAYSTRPGAEEVSQAEEIQRLMPALELIRSEFPDIIISIDTFRAEVARKAIEEGKANIINDISAGTFDPEMFDAVAELQAPYILMHIKGTPQNMQQNPHYENITEEICRFLADKLIVLREKGVNDIIIDPGFGFGKTLEHNYQLMAQLDVFRFFELPLLVGISRKSMITKLLDISANEALPGTTALNTFALLHGADILRVHDVRESRQAIAIVKAIQKHTQNDNL